MMAAPLVWNRINNSNAFDVRYEAQAPISALIHSDMNTLMKFGQKNCFLR